MLGPLFFSLYINDIYEAVGMDYPSYPYDASYRLFGDDTALYMWNKNLPTLAKEIRFEFSSLYKWCVSNKFIMNSDKTNFVTFHMVTKRIQTLECFTFLKLDGQEFELSGCFFVSCLSSASVIAVPYAISWYIAPHYNRFPLRVILETITEVLDLW